MTAFPTIHDLASAQEESVLRLWQGLGYYSRARNLHLTAKFIVEELDGIFPSTYYDIIKLKGVGPYTAAAIASICFGEARPVVDGNVFRFASRYFGIDADISKSGSRKIFESTLEKVISTNDPGNFNQALMEYGATVCAPNPQCEQCSFALDCFAANENAQKLLPVKTGKIKVKERHFNYLVFKHGERYYMKERTGKDVWNGLYDFYLIEGLHDEDGVLSSLKNTVPLTQPLIEEILGPIVHVLSHQRINAKFYSVVISDKDAEMVNQKTVLKSFSIEEVLNLPKPKLIVNYLERVGIK